MDLAGKKIAFIGVGDQEGFGDTFVDGIGIIYDEIKGKGITLVGKLLLMDIHSQTQKVQMMASS